VGANTANNLGQRRFALKKKIWLFILLSAVLFGGTMAYADGDFYVVVGGGAVGTKITALPYTINNPGFYFLGGNLTVNGAGGNGINGITVNADDVTIDLMGFSLTGILNGSYPYCGIYMNGRRNVEIRNGTLKDFVYGVMEGGASGANHRVINVRVYGHTGILLAGIGHLVQNCTASSPSYYGSEGITINGGTITGCVASKYEVGINLHGSGSILGNVSYNNSVGFSLDRLPGDTDTSPRLIDRNNAYGNSPNPPPPPYQNCNYLFYSQSDIWGVNAGR
jgi:hypothetical protein